MITSLKLKGLTNLIPLLSWAIRFNFYSMMIFCDDCDKLLRRYNELFGSLVESQTREDLWFCGIHDISEIGDE